jgi:hypothetical protein
MNNVTLTKAYEASAAVLGFRIAIYSDTAASSKVAQAAASTTPAIGIFDAMGGAAGDMVDVHLAGIAPVDLGGTVTAGAPLMADANGKAIAAVGASGQVRRVIGYAMSPGVSGDRIGCLIAPSVLQLP